MPAGVPRSKKEVAECISRKRDGGAPLWCALP